MLDPERIKQEATAMARRMMVIWSLMASALFISSIYLLLRLNFWGWPVLICSVSAFLYGYHRARTVHILVCVYGELIKHQPQEKINCEEANKEQCNTNKIKS